MKSWRNSQNKFLIAAVAITLTIGTVFIFTTISQSTNTNSSNPNLSLCSTMTEKQSVSNSLQFHPIKLVVEPWRGEHNVYAIFALPLQYQDIYYRSELLVKGTDTPWAITPTDGRKYGATTPEGYFLVIGFFRTRLALLYLVRGKFSELQQPCNWTLYFYPKAK